MKRTLLYIVALLALVSCQKDPEIPIVSFTVEENVDIGTLTVYLSGAISANTEIDAVFVQVSSDEGFGTVTDVQATYDNGQFVAELTNLKPLTNYYRRYCVVNKVNAFTEKNIRSFKTRGYSSPVVSTLSVSDITPAVASCEARLVDNGGYSVKEWGICYATTANPTNSNAKVVASGTSRGTFFFSMSNLKSNTTYYVRAYAINSMGTRYGEMKSFKTKTGEAGYEWVDLGLSVKWATMNVGATNEAGYGNYYAWGDTSTLPIYCWQSYRFCSGSSTSISKYCTKHSSGTVDDKTTLEAEDDVAHVRWGGKWRMPTYAEQEELVENCTITEISDYQGTGVSGRIFTSKKAGYTDKSIFLPSAGYCYDTKTTSSWCGCYWSSTLDSVFSCFAMNLDFTSSGVKTETSIRYYGQSVRAVCP